MGFVERTKEFVKEDCKPIEEKKIITLGDVLDLLDRDDTEVTLYKDEQDCLIGDASCSLWETLKDLPVDCISAGGEDALEVWLFKEDEEDGHDEG